MNRKRLGALSLVAIAALSVSALVVPSASAAKKSIVIWADDTRGPALLKIVKQMEAVVPGYKVDVKAFASDSDWKSFGISSKKTPTRLIPRSKYWASRPLSAANSAGSE